MITATSIGLDENKTPGEYVRQDFHLKEIDLNAELPECNLEISRIGASMVDMNVEMKDNCVAMFYRIFSAADWAPYENADEATMTALAQALDQEGWGIKNINFSQEGSYATTDYQHALDPNGSYVVAYVGRNGYGQLSEVKTETFSTKARVMDNPGASKATIDITISDPGRTSLKLTYTYNQEAAVYYHQYIMTPDLLEEGNKAELIKYIADLVNDKRIEGISNANDESDRDGMRIVIDVKRDANASVVLNKLYKMTALQTSFGVNNVALVHGRPKTLNLRDMIKYFVEHRHEVVIRRTQFDLRKAKERAHILEGLIIASDNIDEVIRIIRAAKTPNDAIAGLIERFNLTEIQSRAIVEMRLRQLTGLMQDQLHAEYEEIMKQIAYLESILADDEVCRKVMKDELLEVKAKYGDERRSEIVYSSEEFNPEDFYADDQMIITISHMGYIKRTPLTEFRAQNRGGVGSKGTETRDADFVEHIYPATMHNTMMFFTQKGKCYWLKVYEIPEGTKNSKGRAIQNLLNIDSDDSVTAYLRVKSLDDSEYINSHYVLFCTKKGVIKKTLLEQYSRPRQNGVNAITIREDDSVIEVRMTNGNNEIIIANRNGRAIRFHEAAVRVMGRTATGVRGITLDNDGQDEVIGMICIKDLETESVMVVSEQGYGKRSEIEDYRKTNRGGKGVKTMNITEKTGKLVTIKSVTDENDLMIINKSGITIRLKVADVRIMGRATQGVRLINLEKRNDQIGSVCKVMTESLEDEIPTEETEGTIVSDLSNDAPEVDNADVDTDIDENNNEIEE